VNAKIAVFKGVNGNVCYNFLKPKQLKNMSAQYQQLCHFC